MRRIFIIFCLLLLPTNVFGLNILDYVNENKNDLEIPVITYHLISEDSSKWSEFCVSPRKLEEDFKLLSANGYKTLNMSELLNIYKALKDNPKIINKYKKSVVLTSDDGYESDFKYIYPLMQKYKIKFNFFVVGSFIDENDYLTSGQIMQMSGNNLVEFGNHSNELHNLNSTALREIYRKTENNNYIINDFLSANNTLAALTKKNPRYLSYPYGEYSTLSDIALKQKGFELRFTTSGECASPLNENTNIGRINRSNSITSSELIKIIKGDRY